MFYSLFSIGCIGEQCIGTGEAGVEFEFFVDFGRCIGFVAEADGHLDNAAEARY